MRRHLLLASAFLSAAIAIMMAAVWLRSEFYWDEWRASGDRQIDLQSTRGVLGLSVESKFSGQNGNFNGRSVVPGDRLWLGDQLGRRVEIYHFRIDKDTSNPLTGPLGFSLTHGDYNSGEGFFQSIRTVSRYGSVPLWLCTAIPLAISVAAFSGARRASKKPGVRRRCGYDLRSTPEHCPECGTVPGRPNNINSAVVTDSAFSR